MSEETINKEQESQPSPAICLITLVEVINSKFAEARAAAEAGDAIIRSEIARVESDLKIWVVGTSVGTVISLLSGLFLFIQVSGDSFAAGYETSAQYATQLTQYRAETAERFREVDQRFVEVNKRLDSLDKGLAGIRQDIAALREER